MKTTTYRQEYENALRLVAEKHSHQMRKGGHTPYITHLVQVWGILQQHRFPTDVCVAGLLHDIAEDQNVSVEEIRISFGPRVADIVAALTECKTDANHRPRAWATRKREALCQLRQASSEAVAVKAADTLHNVRTIAFDVRHRGPEVWKWFNGKPCWMIHVYRLIAKETNSRLPGHPLARELSEAVEDLALLIPDAGSGD